MPFCQLSAKHPPSQAGEMSTCPLLLSNPVPGTGSGCSPRHTYLSKLVMFFPLLCYELPWPCLSSEHLCRGGQCYYLMYRLARSCPRAACSFLQHHQATLPERRVWRWRGAPKNGTSGEEHLLKTLSIQSLKRLHFCLKVSRLETEEHPSPGERMAGLQILEFMSTWRLDKDPLIPGLSKQELDE